MKALWNILCIPFRVLWLIYWDVRCDWLGWHHYTPTRRLEYALVSGKRYWDCYDVCTNGYCRVIRNGSTHFEPYEEQAG